MEDSEVVDRAPDIGDAADFLEVLGLLRSALGAVRGKLFVADAMRLGGLSRRSQYRMSLIARALRHLGWERGRYRIDGRLRYMYAKGTRLQREVILDVVRGEEDQLVVKEKQP